jgi:hypothetical protein
MPNGPTSRRDWHEWHEPYDDPASRLSHRLAIVQRLLREALDACRPGAIRLVSICAGQGRDVTEVLADHPRRTEVTAKLVELDPRNVEAARRVVAARGLQGVDVVQANAGTTDAYLGAVPAEVILVCGVFGNITDEDVARTIRTLPSLGAPGASVIWTRHCNPPDLTPAIRGWFEQAGFAELAFEHPEGTWFGVGHHRLEGEPVPFEPGRTMFEFVGYDRLGGERGA